MSSEKFRVFVCEAGRAQFDELFVFRDAGWSYLNRVLKRCTWVRAARASGGVLDYSSPNGRWPLHIIYSGLLAYIMVY